MRKVELEQRLRPGEDLEKDWTPFTLTVNDSRHEVSMAEFRVCLSYGVIGLLLSGAAQTQAPISRNDTDRADALLKQMTTEEKIGQLNQPLLHKTSDRRFEG
jgi:hypothetical protein